MAVIRIWFSFREEKTLDRGEEQDIIETLLPDWILTYTSVWVQKTDIPATFSTKHNFGLSPEVQLYLLICLIFWKNSKNLEILLLFLQDYKP